MVRRINKHMVTRWSQTRGICVLLIYSLDYLPNTMSIQAASGNRKAARGGGEAGTSGLEVVPEAGVEPARGVTAHDFESCMTANSITPARQTSL